MSEKMNVGWSLIHLAPRVRDQVAIGEVALEITVVRAERSCAAHPGKRDDVWVIRATESRCCHSMLLIIHIGVRNSSGPAGLVESTQVAPRRLHAAQLPGQLPSEYQAPIGPRIMKPLEDRQEIAVGFAPEHEARYTCVDDNAHPRSALKQAGLLFQEELPVAPRWVHNVPKAINVDRVNPD